MPGLQESFSEKCEDGSFAISAKKSSNSQMNNSKIKQEKPAQCLGSNDARDKGKILKRTRF